MARTLPKFDWILLMMWEESLKFFWGWMIYKPNKDGVRFKNNGLQFYFIFFSIFILFLIYFHFLFLEL